MSDVSLPDGYDKFLSGIKGEIQSVQVRASLAVSRELILLYWRIGREILERQARHGWGAKVIDRLAADLRTAFPGIEGFSPRNLKYMRSFADAYPDQSIVQQAVALLPWGHQVRVLDKVKDSRSTALVHPCRA